MKGGDSLGQRTSRLPPASALAQSLACLPYAAVFPPLSRHLTHTHAPARCACRSLPLSRSRSFASCLPVRAGSLADPSSQFGGALDELLLPDTPYAHDSGGHPRDIPRLDFDQLKGQWSSGAH